MGGYGNIAQLGRMIAQMLARGLDSGLMGMADGAAAKAALDARQRRMLDQITTEEARDLAKMRLRKAQANLKDQGFSGFGIEDGIATLKKSAIEHDSAQTGIAALFVGTAVAALAAAGIDYITNGALSNLLQNDNIGGYKVDENGVVTPVRYKVIKHDEYYANYKDKTKQAAQLSEEIRIRKANEIMAKNAIIATNPPQKNAEPAKTASDSKTKRKRRRKKKGSEGQT